MSPEKMSVVVSENGDVSIDGSPIAVDDFTQQLLEKIVDYSLEDKVDYNIEGDLPISRFFRKLQDGTKEGSQLRSMKEQYDRESAEKTEAGRKFAKSHADDPA